MTTDLSGCADSGFPDFPWDDFDSILQSTEAYPLDRGAGPSEATRTGSPLIRHCGQLQPQIDAPLSPQRTRGDLAIAMITQINKRINQFP